MTPSAPESQPTIPFFPLFMVKCQSWVPSLARIAYRTDTPSLCATVCLAGTAWTFPQTGYPISRAFAGGQGIEIGRVSALRGDIAAPIAPVGGEEAIQVVAILAEECPAACS